ncbi:zinc finger and BTB domain-containing protein 17-like isoform X2 [Colossoma macropomum]|uniref:zinc finger and BTB domain-containing protein 17-like isoform X2 n=1 Tax=Colossoma macropomum TaxID=42526 RepID=UPI0018644AD3|nr:zinc finger and BTB domain-containing protein 17-like isoform X2 [Colossoma macropomum]
MVNQCCVLRCPSKAKRTTKRFHRFPKDLNICRLWLSVIKHRLASENINRDSVKNLRVCSDHFLPEDYRERSLNNSLNAAAVPSVFPWSLTLPPQSSEAGVQDCGPKDEPSPALRMPQPDHKFPHTDQQHSTSASSCTVLAQRTRSEVFSEKENTPTPLSTCSEVEEKSWCKAVRSLQSYQGTNIFKGSEVLVSTQCLLELFQYCSLCQIESCITIEGHERQFSITQDCQSCGYHRQWRSHPTPADEPAEALNTQHKDPEEVRHEEHTEHEDILHKEHEDDDVATSPKVERAAEPGDREENEVEVQIASSDDEGTEQNCEQNDESYSSSTEEETSEQEEVEKKGKRKSKKQDSSDEWEPHLGEVATDSDVSVDEDSTLIEDGQGKVVMWCTVCRTDATLSCSLHRHKKVFACAQCGAGDDVETHHFDKLLVHFDDFASFQKHAEKEHGAKPFRKLCQECGKLILAEPKSSGCKDHICEHKTKPIVCPECGKRFLTEVGLKGHCSRLHKDADHPCKYCLKLFTNRPSKLEHEQTHPKEKQPYSCPDCPERFDNIHKRNSHLKLHRGPYKYACDTCGKRFRDIIMLKRHKLIHSGEKPFRCQVCDRSFNQMSNLSSTCVSTPGRSPSCVSSVESVSTTMSA